MFWLLSSSWFRLSLCGAHSTECALARRKRTHSSQTTVCNQQLKSPPESWRAFFIAFNFSIGRFPEFPAAAAYCPGALVPADHWLLSFYLLPSWPAFPPRRLCGSHRAKAYFHCSCPPRPSGPWPVERACPYPRECPAAAFCWLHAPCGRVSPAVWDRVFSQIAALPRITWKQTRRPLQLKVRRLSIKVFWTRITSSCKNGIRNKTYTDYKSYTCKIRLRPF